MEPEPSQRGTPPDEARAAEPHGEEAGLDRIREILFGSAQRDLERRLARFASQASARLLDLEQEIRRRLEMLELHVRRESETLVTRLQGELGATSETLRRVTREQREALRQLEDKLARVEEDNAQGQRDLRHQLLEQAKTFLDELQRVRRDLLASLEQDLDLEDDGRAGAAGDAEGPRH